MFQGTIIVGARLLNARFWPHDVRGTDSDGKPLDRVFDTWNPNLSQTLPGGIGPVLQTGIQYPPIPRYDVFIPQLRFAVTKWSPNIAGMVAVNELFH